MRYEALLVVVLAAAVVSPAPAVETMPRERTGYAYDLGGGALIYTEEHREWMEDGRVVRSTVTYRDPDGEIIATKRLDFAGDSTHPDFRLENRLNGHVEGAEQDGKRLAVVFRKTDEQRLKTETIAQPDQAIIDGGFDRFIETHWDRLLAGEVFKRPFLVPSFHRFVDFRIYLEETKGTEVVFVMEPASFLLRMVGDGIVVRYQRDDATLKHYEGISNIRDQSGENYEVQVEFRGGVHGAGDSTAAADGAAR